jgi:hypothetical protein
VCVAVAALSAAVAPACADPLAPLPAVQAGQPIYPRVDGRLAFGTADNAVLRGPREATPDEVATIAASLGASFVRLNLQWPAVESQPGRFDWRQYDTQYQALIAHGLRPLWTVHGTPRYAVSRAARQACKGRGDNFCPSEPADTRAGRRALRRFGAAIARQYPLAAGLEYRNEPNVAPHGRCTQISDPTAPGIWRIRPRRYARDLAPFAAGVRSAQPAMRILGGALSGCPTRYAAYAAAMLRAGAARSMSALSWHPNGPRRFGDSRESFAAKSQRLQEAITAAGHPQLRIVAGEVSARIGGRPYQSPEVVSDTLRRQFHALSDPTSGIALAAQTDAFVGFEDIDRAAEPGFGWLMRRDAFGAFTARPVYCDWRQMLAVAVPQPEFVHGCGVPLPVT